MLAGNGTAPAVKVVYEVARVNRIAQATGERASKDELEELAAWQAQSPESASFEGGAAANAVWIGLAIVCLLVIGIYTLFIEPGRVRPGS